MFTRDKSSGQISKIMTMVFYSRYSKDDEDEKQNIYVVTLVYFYLTNKDFI